MNMTSQEKVFKVKTCRLCGGKTFKKWVDFGMQPLANELVSAKDSSENFYPLSVMACKGCGLIQLTHVVDPDILFGSYVYYSSTSKVFRDHFFELAQRETNTGRIKQGDLVVDIGSNDGILLTPFKQMGATVLGVEPCGQIANKAAANGIETIPEYFTKELAERIIKDYGKPSLVTMTNVLAHIDNSKEVLDGLEILAGDWGRVMIEVPYTPEMIKVGTFDLIYHEHLSYFTAYTLSKLFTDRGFGVFDLEFVPVHGGSIRMFFGKKGVILNEEFIKRIIARDKNITDSKEFHEFPKRIEKNKQEFLKFVAGEKKKGKRFIGYGAPAKMATLTNYYDIPANTIDYIIDDASAKQNKFSPGKHIKIVPSLPDLAHCTHDYMIIFAWNFADSIMNMVRIKGYKGKFVIPFPTVKVI